MFVLISLAYVHHHTPNWIKTTRDKKLTATDAHDENSESDLDSWILITLAVAVG